MRGPSSHLTWNDPNALIRLMHEFSREMQPLLCDVIIGKQYLIIKLDHVSCTNYFMSIHNLRYSVQLTKIATRNKKIFEQIPRFWLFKQLCTRLPSWPLRNFQCDVNVFVSPVTRSGQCRHVWTDSRIN